MSDMDATIGNLRAEILKVLTERRLLINTLLETLDYFEDAADAVDGDYGIPQPNSAAVMAEVVRTVLRKVVGTEP